MEPLREILTYFALSGETLIPDECTKIIGIQPTDCCLKGDMISLKPHRRFVGEWRLVTKNPLLRPFGEWCIKTGWLDIDDTNDGIDLVMNTIWPHRDAILKILENPDIESCVVSAIEIFGMNPAYWINQQNLYRMSYLKCQYTWDIYDYREEK